MLLLVFAQSGRMLLPPPPGPLWYPSPYTEPGPYARDGGLAETSHPPMSQHHGAMKPSQNRTCTVSVSTRSWCRVHLEPALRADSRSEAGGRYNEDGAKRRSMKEEVVEKEVPRSWRLGALTPEREGCMAGEGVGR